MATKNNSENSFNNPWKGLNFYHEGEILYGRDDEIQSLALYVTNNTQTVLYGKSGIGKSSIINAGVFPIARKEGLFPIPIRLKHDSDTDYTSQIKAAFKESAIGINEILTPLDKFQETLWEYLHRNTFYDKETGISVRPLIVLDQFEEIFTLQHDEKKKLSFFSELADLLNEITPNYIAKSQNAQSDKKPKNPEANDNAFSFDFGVANDSDEDKKQEYISESLFNIVFTIREDFLSYLERYTKFIPVMKSNRYALLPINEEQAKDIIMKPVEGLIDINVAKLIIEKVTGRIDFALDDAPEIEVDAAVLSLFLSRLYIKKGEDVPTVTATLVDESSKDIIKDFYEESVKDLPTGEIEKLEDLLLTYDNRRDNVSRNDLLREGISEKVIKILVEDRKLLRQFSYQEDIRVEFMHDILCSVVNERIEQREIFRKKEEEDREREEERKLLVLKNRKRLTLALSLSATIILFLALFWFLLRMPVSNNYAGFTTYNGWPIGIGPKLNDTDIKNMVVHYRLTRRGLWKASWNPYFKVEVLNRNGQHSTNILVESPIVSLAETDGSDKLSRDFASKQLRVSYWSYTADEDGNVSRQTAYDLDKKVLYSVQYYREAINVEKQDVQTLWMNFVDEEGKSLRLRKNGADRMRVTQKNGYVTKCVFFNETGTPQQNSRKAYGYKYEINQDDGYCIAILPLDEYGDTIQGQSLRFNKFDTYLRWTDSDFAHAVYGPNQIIYNMGLRIDSLLYDDNGHQIYRSEFIHGYQLRTFTYDIFGNLKKSNVFKLSGDKKMVLVNCVVCNYLNDSDSLLEKTEYIAEASIKYTREVHNYEKDIHTTIYYCGNDTSLLKKGNKVGEDYYKVVSKTEFTDSTRLTVTTFYGTRSVDEGIELRREEIIYNRGNDLPLRKIYYTKGKRTMSLEYELEDNLITGQHVIGITGAIIRCPAWDDNHLCYYRKKFIRNFAGDIVAAKGVNEFGEESLITYGNHEIQTSIAPGDEIKEDGNDYTIFGTGSFKYSAPEANPNQKVEYLHITDTLGTYYRCGLRDGDILVSSANHEVKVARAVLNKATPNAQPKYEVLSFQPQKGENGIECYPVYFTEKEMHHLNNSLIVK